MKKVTFDEKEFKKLFPVTENAALAKRYKVAESTIRLWGAKYKINKKMWLWSRNDENYVLKHAGKDHTFEEVAEKLGRSRWSIYAKYREMTNKETNK